MQLCILGLVVACLFSPFRVLADPGGASAGEPSGYKAAINAAIEEFDQGNFVEAREHFSRAHALSPNARTLRGLGMSEFELKNYVAAVEMLEQALASEQKGLDGALRQQTSELLARARAYVGEIVLVLKPAATSVRVDGIPAKVTDQRLRLAVGDHVLEFNADGRAPERRSVRVRGEQRVELAVQLPELGVGLGERTPSDVSPSGGKGTPVYKRWWLWTCVAAVLAGGATAAVILSTQGERVNDPNGGSTGSTFYVQ